MSSYYYNEIFKQSVVRTSQTIHKKISRVSEIKYISSQTPQFHIVNPKELRIYLIQASTHYIIQNLVLVYLIISVKFQ